MDVGVIALCTDQSATLAQLAVAAEARGLSALFQGDHTHIPSSRTTPFIAAPELPDEYTRLLEPLVGLATAAACTSRITLGTCIFLLAQRDPIATAKQVATLDHLAGGRFVLGIGYGWNVEEAADHGVEWATRRHRVREYVAAMRELWSAEKATYHGKFVRFDEAWMWPKPLARPRLPVVLGAGPSPRVFAEIVQWADGWLPVPPLGHRPQHVTTLRHLAEEHGRDPASLRIIVDGLPPDPAAFLPWAEVGAEMGLVHAPAEPLDAVLPVLDAAASVATALGAGAGHAS